MMETVGLIVVHSSLLVFTLLSCARTKNEKAAATPGVLGAPTKDAVPAASVQDEAPAPAASATVAPAPTTAASTTVSPAPAPEASPAAAPTPPSAASSAAPSVDRADAPSDVSTASPAVSTASPPTVATVSSPSVSTAASPARLSATSPLVLTATLYSDSFTESIKEEHARNYIKCVGSESLPGKFVWVINGPSERYGIIRQSSEDKPVLFPMFVVDVCSSSYTMYSNDKSDERIQQIQNGEFYWLADDLIVIVLYKNNQLIRYIYELDHQKKTVSFVYTGEDTCKFLVQSTHEPIETSLQEVNIQNRKYIAIVGREYRRFQLFNRDPRVEPRYPHSFRFDVPGFARHLRLTGAEYGIVYIPFCSGSKIRFMLLKDRLGLTQNGLIVYSPNQILTFDLEKVVEKQPDGHADTVVIGPGDTKCWSVMTLELAEQDILLKCPCSILTEESYIINIFSKAHTDKARPTVRMYATIIDFDTKKCYRKKFSTKRNTTLDIKAHPYLRIEEWTWDKTSGGLSWTTLKSFPPTKVATLQDFAREAVMRNRQKYSQDLPDLAGIVFPQ